MKKKARYDDRTRSGPDLSGGGIRAEARLANEQSEWAARLSRVRGGLWQTARSAASPVQAQVVEETAQEAAPGRRAGRCCLRGGGVGIHGVALSDLGAEGCARRRCSNGREADVGKGAEQGSVVFSGFGLFGRREATGASTAEPGRLLCAESSGPASPTGGLAGRVRPARGAFGLSGGAKGSTGGFSSCRGAGGFAGFSPSGVVSVSKGD